MPIEGSWSITYKYLGENTTNNASMTIKTTNPLDGLCTLDTEPLQMSGFVATIGNEQWLYFSCMETSGTVYKFSGFINPLVGKGIMVGGAVIPRDSQTAAGSGTGTTDPGDEANWTASHN